MSALPTIVDFYDNKLRVSKLQKTFHEWVYQATDAEWETCHDFIQWLFPNPHVSPHAPRAYLSEEEFEIFDMDPIMQIKLTEAFARYLTFLGFTRPADQNKCWPYVDKNKIHKTQHNVLRISRVLCCMHLAGFAELAATFLYNLLQLIETDQIHVTALTQREWKRTALGDEWVPANNKDCIVECLRISS